MYSKQYTKMHTSVFHHVVQDVSSFFFFVSQYVSVFSCLIVLFVNYVALQRIGTSIKK